MVTNEVKRGINFCVAWGGGIPSITNMFVDEFM
jgi:hypothetical protein